MASVSYRGEVPVLDTGEGGKRDTCPPKYLGDAPGTIMVNLSGFDPGTYLVMVSKVSVPSSESDQNKEGGLNP